MRSTNCVATHKRVKRIRRLCKGYWGDRKNHLRLGSDAVMRAMANSYRHRK